MNERPLTLQDLIRRRQAGGFVGRREQLNQFDENLRLAVDDPLRRFLFSLHGDAGVGKTFLVNQFIRIARKHGYATGYVNETVYDIPTALETIVADLDRQDVRCKELSKRLDAYRERSHELDADPNAPEEMSSLLTRSVVRVGLRATGDIPIIGAVTEELDADAVAAQIDRFRTFLSRKFRNHDDVRLLLSPTEVLTPALVQDLTSISERKPIALFFDTYERTATFLDSWLLDLLAGRYGGVPASLVLTIAGQRALNVNRWGDYLGLWTDIGLRVFTDEEARELLADRGVTDDHIIEVILALSGRLPVWVAMLAEARPDSVQAVGDPSGSAVERFLKWETDERRRTAALHGALPRRLDQEIFAAAADSVSAAEDFAWLRRLPFVVEHADCYRYHDVVRTAMLRVVRRSTPTEWQRRHNALADHYRNAREALGLSGQTAWKDERWQELAREEHYHRLCAQASKALPEALGGLAIVFAWQPAMVVRWGQMIRQAGRDADAPVVEKRGERLVAWAESQDDDDQLRILNELAEDSGLNDRCCAIAHAERGNFYRLRGRYDDALADFDRACELQPDVSWIIAGRGETYRLMRRYEEALRDFDRAADLDPRYGWAVANRALTYRLMGRFEEALADFDRAVELDPRYRWAIGERGRTHRLMGRFEEALADFDRAVELNPQYRWAIGERGKTYRLMGRFEEALADFDRAIELDPRYRWAIGERGKTYRLMGRFEEALADFDRAVELNPRYRWAIGERGKTYRLMGRFEEALADFDRAIELDSGYRWAITNRGVLYRLLGRHEDALGDFDRAVELSLTDGWSHYQAALVLSALGKTDAARERLRRAIDCDSARGEFPLDGWRALNLAVYLVALGETQRAERYLRQNLERTILPISVRYSIEDFEELGSITGRDVAPFVELLRQHLP